MTHFNKGTSIRLSPDNQNKIEELKLKFPEKFPDSSRVLRVGLIMLYKKHFPKKGEDQNE